MIDLSHYRSIVVLTGAGISVASGLRTFRGPGGVWEEHRVEEYGNVSCLTEDPVKTWTLFGGMRHEVSQANLKAAHHALSRAESMLRPEQSFTLITQNGDALHQKAGNKNVLELHGRLCRTRCTNEACTTEPFDDFADHAGAVPRCASCGSILRPDVVLFGERIPPYADWQSKRALRDVDLFMAIGTFGSVAPASSFVRSATYVGARTVFVNIEPLSPPNPYFDETHIGRAEEILGPLLGIDAEAGR